MDLEWIRSFSIGILKESPSPALRSCLTLAQGYYPIVRQLFNSGFISCWNELDQSNKDDLIANLRKALSSPSIPAGKIFLNSIFFKVIEILQILLNLTEFMEHENIKLKSIPYGELSSLAEKCHAYAKALYYKEEEFLQDSNTNPGKYI